MNIYDIIKGEYALQHEMLSNNLDFAHFHHTKDMWHFRGKSIYFFNICNSEESITKKIYLIEYKMEEGKKEVLS